MIPDSTRHRPHYPPLSRHRIPHRPTNRKFIVKLISTHHTRSHSNHPVDSIVSQCTPKPFQTSTRPPSTGSLAAKLSYGHQIDAVKAFIFLWEKRLLGDHLFNPIAEFAINDETNDKIRVLFQLYCRSLLEGEILGKLERRVNELSVDVEKICKKPKGLGVFDELKGEKERLVGEVDGIVKRIEEFKFGVKCVLDYLEKKDAEGGDMELRVLLGFRNGKSYNWSKLHCLLLRECRRVEDGLPMYGFRREILRQIHSQQVIVLIGETGSGKSTQLVQYLADSGVAASGSILCTQPRKISALSLAKRVGEDTSGCYDDNSVVCFPNYSSRQLLHSKVIYMTDHCLMRHLMRDKTLSGVSCIIVDEAHDRSLNTDLLLALIKHLLIDRHDLRLVIMSATVDATKISEYFFGCGTFHVMGRNFPVDIKYVPGASEGSSVHLFGVNNIAPYVSDAVKRATEIHQEDKEGAVLAFLTSQLEVEWACEKFHSPSAIVLPLHGKLSQEEQSRVFQNYPGKRKVIFATNLAETSLTIPGVKFVIDSGMVKERKFEPSSGMTIFRVSKISQSSAKQRAGRAGRTEPGKCYRLYSKSDYQSMALHQQPGIYKVHLGIAVLRILALGIKNVLDFDFIDAPSETAVDMAIKNLKQLGAVTCKNNFFELTSVGHDLVKLDIEPRLGKIILDSFHCGLRKEGVVLAAVMANASSIFCRVGTDDDKLKSDCLKVQFCHQDGDLFTLLTVYREWEDISLEDRNKWCWNNSINAKTMRKCNQTVQELENCLRTELNKSISSYWVWKPHAVTGHDRSLKKIILSSLIDNVAMYSGYDGLGYQVALSGEYAQLHPSCSLQAYSGKPNWVVFSELLSASSQYLVCVTAVDFDSLSACNPPSFDISKMQSRKLQLRVIKGFSSTALKRFCGKANHNLRSVLSRIRRQFTDKPIDIEISWDKYEVLLYASLQDMEKVYGLVNDALEYEMKWLNNECLEKRLCNSGRAGAALFGAGAEIRHLELENRCLSVDVFLSDRSPADDKEILTFLEKSVSGVCWFHRFAGSKLDTGHVVKWGRVTFLTPEATRKALEFNGFDLSGSLLKLSPASTGGGSHKLLSFLDLRAKITWPRRYSKGCAIVTCERNEAQFVVRDCFDLPIGGRLCELSTKGMNCIVIEGLDRETSESEIHDALQMSTGRRILKVFLKRGDAVNNNPSISACEDAILKEIAPFMPNQAPLSNYCHVQVHSPNPKDVFMKAWITFDGRLHLEAAKALQHIQGKVIAGCFSWQKMQCEQKFHSFVSCPAPVRALIERQLNSLLKRFNLRPGVECSEEWKNGSYRVKISANATKIVAELRKPLEQLMNGKTVDHGSLTPAVVQLLFSADGRSIMSSLQQETRTYILFDRHNLNVRIYGPENKIALAEQKLIRSLLSLHDKKQMHIPLRGGVMPHNLMKKVVEKFGPDLHVLKEMFPDSAFTLNTRRHVISLTGKEDLRLRVEDIVHDFARSLSINESEKKPEFEATSCPICLCEVEECYQLEACAHKFCQSCLVEQLESAMRGRDGFPIRCTYKGCGMHILLADLKSLLPGDKLDDLFRASVWAFVASSGGKYRFCPSPDCPSVYRVIDTGTLGGLFRCGACYAETCTRCHLEYHPYVSCEQYKMFKDDPDLSLKDWRKGKDHVKSCPVCRYVIEKIDGCNHIECKCGKHVCWVCLEFFSSSEDCYGHLREIHKAIQ
ncbi:ATP-dependent RNA helicase DEAH11, chloroplastic-like [Mercurialis annua]|uniref:ATP-dependent RNA helicase DEAH11, chloroplastic-like n=1 Tax=Mercurialis annua TaxID=3986 RepID=UPI00215E37C3|nr:ATP-dependent RNA helicase DEAH11, chloroplastic-like [Mercurialis annua]